MKTWTTLEGLKRAANALKKAEGIKHNAALERLAREAGYKNYQSAMRALQEQEA
jgi:hypothetical protein